MSAVGRELGLVVYIRSNEALLLLNGRIVLGLAFERSLHVVVIIAPFSLPSSVCVRASHKRKAHEVICKLQSDEVCVRILEVDHDKLFVRVLWKHEWGLSIWNDTQNIAVLSLGARVSRCAIDAFMVKFTSLCAKTSCCLRFSAPSYCLYSHVRYFSNVAWNKDQSAPQTSGRVLLPSVASMSLSSQETICSQRGIHLSMFSHTNGPSSRSCGSNSIPSCNSRIRFAICFETPVSRSSFGVRARALKNSSKRPFVKVPSNRGPIFFRPRRLRICNSDSRSINWSTLEP